MGLLNVIVTKGSLSTLCGFSISLFTKVKVGVSGESEGSGLLSLLSRLDVMSLSQLPLTSHSLYSIFICTEASDPLGSSFKHASATNDPTQAGL